MTIWSISMKQLVHELTVNAAKAEPPAASISFRR